MSVVVLVHASLVALQAASVVSGNHLTPLIHTSRLVKGGAGGGVAFHFVETRSVVEFVPALAFGARFGPCFPGL